MLPKGAPVGQDREIAHAEPAHDAERDGDSVRNPGWSRMHAGHETCERECQPGGETKSDQAPEQVGVAHQNKITNTADKAHSRPLAEIAEYDADHERR